MMIICAIVLGVLVIAGVLFAVLRRPKKTANLQSLRQEAAAASGGSAEEPESSAPRSIEIEMPDPSAGRLVRLRARLARSNNMLGKGLLSLLSRDRIDQDVWDEVEETLLLADLGSEPTTRLVEALQKRVRIEGTNNPAAVKKMLREELVKIVGPDMDRELKTAGSDGNPGVVLVVGVNGVGKTTTVGKIARVMVADGRSLMDTAGRLQNKAGLMDQLGKIKRVIEKEAPVTEVLLVIDATTGQNGMIQAKVFGEIVDVTGIVLTKLDGTAKGGIVVAIQEELGVPVKLIGLGEGPDDLAPFDPEAFVDALLD